MITHISDTARWIARYRALESARPDAVFRDPFADRLAGPEGKQIVDTMPNGTRMMWVIVVRTAVIDELVIEAVRSRGADMVIDLAAGLDSRAWRLDLPATLEWVDVDLPGILDYKLEVMKNEKPRCAYEAIRLDLSDVAQRQALFAQLGARARKALVITEGLLIYLEDQAVAGIARDLHAQPSFRWWVSDLVGPRVLSMIKRQRRGAFGSGISFRFAPADGTRFFEPFGWKEAAFRSSMLEARRLKREMKAMWLWRAIGRLYSAKTRAAMPRMSGVMLLERD